jgi:hypothetical protein
MPTAFPFVPLPEKLRTIIGEPDPDTRLYRQVGSKEECGAWFDAISEEIGQTVSPGGVSMYAKVSKAATYKRIKEGRLTAFCFHEVEIRKGFLGGSKKVQKSPFIYVPVSEAKAWGKELQARLQAGETLYREDIEGEEPDFCGDFFEWDSKWRKTRLKQFSGKPLR